MTRDDARSDAGPPFRRPWRATVVGVVVLVLAGLTTANLGSGPVGDALGDALYAALVLVLATFALPGHSRRVHVTVALGICWAIEFAQATGGPEIAVRAWPPLRYVLGTTFAATDLLWYAVGVLAMSRAMVLASRRSGGTRRAATGRA